MQIALVVLAVATLLIGIFSFWRRPASQSRAAPTDRRSRPRPMPFPMPAVAPVPAASSAAAVSLIVPGPADVMDQLYAVAFDGASVAKANEPPNPEHAAMLSHAIKILDGITTQPRYTPRRPTQLPHLMQTLREDDASIRAISHIVAQDPALAGNLLRVANSPIYRVSQKPVESIERAITLLGTEGLRSMVTAALLQPVLTGESGVFGKFSEIIWEHSLFSASIAETHAGMIEKTDSFAAQLLGLMHGLGSIIVFRVARDQYAARKQLAPDAAVIAGLLEAHAAPTAQRIAASWQLSERITDALTDQTRHTNQELLSPLGRSLRFGRFVGALVMLCKLGKLQESLARAALLQGEKDHAPVVKIWERMVKGHRLE
ncbi:MAG: HDOD domain-containing protein [Steroidobacteraceae bacterium]